MEMYPSPTAGWSDEEQVSWYLDRMEALQPRLAGEAVLRQLSPPSWGRCSTSDAGTAA